MNELQRAELLRRYQILKEGGAPLAALLTFRGVNGLGEDEELNAALAEDARSRAVTLGAGVRIEPVARVAARKPARSRRAARQRQVDPTKLYYSGLEGDL